MAPQPRDEMRDYRGTELLEGRRALVTGGDSGIGRAAAIAFAKEGADVAIAYLSEDEDADARRTCDLIEAEGRRAVSIRTDLSEEANCREAVERTVAELGGLDLLVNNIAYQNPVDAPEEISAEQWERTFRTNIHSYFWTTQAALAHLGKARRSSTRRRSTGCGGTRPSSTTRRRRARSTPGRTPWPRL